MTVTVMGALMATDIMAMEAMEAMEDMDVAMEAMDVAMEAKTMVPISEVVVVLKWKR